MSKMPMHVEGQLLLDTLSAVGCRADKSKVALSRLQQLQWPIMSSWSPGLALNHCSFKFSKLGNELNHTVLSKSQLSV